MLIYSEPVGGGGGEAAKALARFFHISLGNRGSSVTDTSDASKVTFIA